MTQSRNNRKKKLRRAKGPSSKTLKKQEEKLLQERLKRLKARPKQQKFEKPAKTGRNDPCPCGSGKKFKQCCLWGSDAAEGIQKFLNKLGESKYESKYLKYAN